MKLPAYGRALAYRQAAGERPLFAGLLVGNSWRLPHWVPAGIPKLAVRPAPWHTASTNGAVSCRSAPATAREPCAVCGSAEVEPHDGRWLCRPHHEAVHAIRDRAVDGMDWRVVSGMSVLAIDTRAESEVEYGTDDWDAWLWLLTDVQRYAHEVLLFTPTITFHDPPEQMAPERALEVYAWINRRVLDGQWTWPAWWPHGDLLAKSAA